MQNLAESGRACDGLTDRLGLSEGLTATAAPSGDNE